MKNNVPSIFECESINLGFDVDFLCAVLFDPLDINFAIKMTNVANNGIIFHGGDFISFAHSLKGVDRIDLRDNDTTSKASQRLSRSLADISVSGNKGDLSSQHDISGPLDSVAKRFTATVQ